MREIMLGVMVLYNPERRKKQDENSRGKKRFVAKEKLQFISPRLCMEGEPQLLLDITLHGNPPSERRNFRHPRMACLEEVSARTDPGREKSDGKKLKNVCCEKYLKGKRCKRCPCFDLQ